MSTSSSIRDNYIRIGDYVTLKFLKNQSYLSAEGILIEEVGVSSSLRFFEEHLFQIYVQRQYSATNELEEFSKHYPEDFDFSEQDPATVNHFEALLKGKENETKMNLNVMKNKTGNLLCFGDTIQLLHVKSRKFIQVNLTTARDERENMQVSLNSDGNVMSWIKLLPRYKIDKEGDLITNNTELVLKVSERSNEYLHCADRNPTRGKNREVNSSLEQTPWRINVFKRSDDAQKTSLLMTGDLVYIRDPESLSMISPIAKPINLENKRMDRLKSSTPVTPKSANGDNPWNLPMIRSAAESYDAHDGDDDLCRDDISVSTMDEFCSDHGDVVLQPMEEDNLSTDALWMMESKSITKGGILKYRVDTVHFRHFNTGKYLAFVPKSAAGDAFVMTMVNEPNETETLFFVLEIHSNEELLGNAKAVQIKHAFHGVFIERGPFNNNYQLHSCKSTRKNNKAVNVIVNRYIQKEKFSIAKHNEDSIGEVLDIYFARAVLHTIVRFIKNTSIPMNSNTSEISIWPKMAVNDRNLFSIVIARAALFVQGYPTSLDQQNLSNYKTEAYVITRRQNIFREQGLLQEILLLLDILQPISDWVVSDASANKLVKGGFLEVGRVVVSECLNLLYDLIKGNIRNQKYIADHLLVILAHVSSDRMAAKVAQELLSSNRELQETKISFKEIRTFAQKMRDIPMNSMYLQLLQTCCSCMVRIFLHLTNRFYHINFL